MPPGRISAETKHATIRVIIDANMTIIHLAAF